MTNPIKTIEVLIPNDYDFDTGEIKGDFLVGEILRNMIESPELEVRTRRNGDKHFMARCKGASKVDIFSMDDVCDFILTTDNIIKYMFTGTDGEDESDWIFDTELGHKERWEDAIERRRLKLDEEVIAFMDRFDYPQTSFDEWIYENGEKLKKEDCDAAHALLRRYPEYGGDCT